MPTLDEHLANCMAEHHGIGNIGSKKALAEALCCNPGMAEQAEIRRKYYESYAGKEILKRDHVSRVHSAILREVLGNNG